MLKIYCDGCNTYIKDCDASMNTARFVHDIYCDVCKSKADAFREWCFKAERLAEVKLREAIAAKRIEIFGGP